MVERWTKSDTETLIQLWPEESASAIGGVLGRTRNAVIGMAHRLQLPMKGNKGDPRKGAERKPRRPYAPIKPRRPIELEPKVIHRKEEPYTGPIPLLESKGFHCKAIIDGQRDAEGLAMVCGKPVVQGQQFSFCFEHLERFTTKGGYRYDRSQPIVKPIQ